VVAVNSCDRMVCRARPRARQETGIGREHKETIDCKNKKIGILYYAK
jgi:hypothetical protein